MNRIFKIGVGILVIIFTLILLSTVSNAASFSASISKTEVNVGDTVTVTVTADNAAGMYSVTASNSNLSKTSGDTSEFLENGSTTITYKAVTAGTTTITAKATDMTDLDDDSKKVTGSKTFTVTIKAKEEEKKEENREEDKKQEETNNSQNNSGNTNNNQNTVNGSNTGTNTGNNNNGITFVPKPEPKVKLASLKINGTMYVKYLKTYLSTTVEGLEYIDIVPKTSNGSSCTVTNNNTKDSATVKSGGTASIKLREGSNTIVVKGEFDDIYTISVTNKAKEEEVEPNVIEEDIKVILKSLAVKGVNEEEKVDFALTPEFASDVYEYTINIPEEQNDITKLDVEAIGDKDEFTVEVTGNEELVDGENIVTILVKSKDGTRTTTYQIKVNKEAKIVETVVAPVQEVPEVEDDNISRAFFKNLIIVFTSVIAIAGIVFAIVEYRYTKNKKEKGEFEKVSYASVGFEKEETKREDLLEELREYDRAEKSLKAKRARNEKNEEIEDDTEEETFELLQEEKPKRRGKHF